MTAGHGPALIQPRLYMTHNDVVAVRYPVRMALVSLDLAPQWFARQSRDHMSADAARAFAKTDGMHLRILLSSSVA